jgi:hypothetical protein
VGGYVSKKISIVSLEGGTNYSIQNWVTVARENSNLNIFAEKW